MRKVIYGKTGYGKSYTYIAPILKENNDTLMITPNISINNELKWMNLSENVLKEIKINDISNVKSGKYGVLTTLHGSDVAIDIILDKIEESGLSDNKSFTVVFINLIMYIYSSDSRLLEFMNRINRWSCNVVFEHTCSSLQAANNELKLNCRYWRGWTQIPVFEKLY